MRSCGRLSKIALACVFLVAFYWLGFLLGYGYTS